MIGSLPLQSNLATFTSNVENTSEAPGVSLVDGSIMTDEIALSPVVIRPFLRGASVELTRPFSVSGRM